MKTFFYDSTPANKFLAPEVGFEPTTLRLTGERYYH
jgi:hypothetical protein